MGFKRSSSQYGCLVALPIYSALSFFYFGPSKPSQFWEEYRGLGADPTIHMWAMSWWPYALAHHLDPLLTPTIFAPSGYNLARAVSLPGPSVLICPITRVFGPVVAYNLLCILCPIAAALSGFVLCRYLSQCFWSALAGGYIFGFSQYVLSQVGAHLFLLFIFPVPLAIYLVLLRLDGKLRRSSFIAAFSAVMIFEFLCSTELFATSTLFGLMTLAMAIAFLAKERSRIIGVAAELSAAFAVIVILLSPYLYRVLAGGVPQVLNPAESYSNDALALVVPTPVLLGGNRFAWLSWQFRDVWTEMAGYLGPGLWLIIVLFALRYWGSTSSKLLLLSFLVIVIASLGPKLHIAGRPVLSLPWLIADKLPLVDLALPGRFGMYLFLIGGLILAIYLGDRELPVAWRCLLAIGALIFVLPDLSFIRAEKTRLHIPDFFSSGQYKHYISPGDIVLILPDTITSTSQVLLWQALTDFYFRNVTGFYLPPEDYQRWPITASFGDAHRMPNFSEQLYAFLGAHQVKAIIVDASASGQWPARLSEAGLAPAVTGGIFFYKVPATVLTSFAHVSAHQMAQKEAAICFGALVYAAAQYVERGLPLANLNPAEAYRLGLLTVLQKTSPPSEQSNWWGQFWLGSWGGLIGVGISGYYDDLGFLVNAYGSEATTVFFPYPHKLGKRPKGVQGLLLFLFTQQGVGLAEKRAPSSLLVVNQLSVRSFSSTRR
jgi:hypothetical protein